MLIDEFMPSWDVVKRHQIEVQATPARTLASVREMDPGRDWLIGAMLRIRGFQRPPRTWSGFGEVGFIDLGQTDQELLIGVVGRFWTVGGGLRAVDPDRFLAFTEANHAKATWNFSVEDGGGASCVLKTETRVVCTDAGARRKFRAYWAVVGPFSGLIRSRVLRQIKETAEST